MKCPQCNNIKTSVLETIPNEGLVYRRRCCMTCGALFKSVENYYDGIVPAKRRYTPKPTYSNRNEEVKVTDASVFNVWK